MKDARAGRRRSGRTQPAPAGPASPAETEPVAEPEAWPEPATAPAPPPTSDTHPAAEPMPGSVSAPGPRPASAPTERATERPPRTSRTTRAGGRPRDPQRETEIVAQALDLVASEGLPGLTMDAVASRAGASKATLYRRWPDRLCLAVHLLERAVAERPPMPSTGTVRDDLAALLRSLDEDLHGAVGALVLGLAAEARRAPNLAEDLETYRAAEQDRARTVLAAGLERGELDPGTDLDLLAVMSLATSLERAITSAAPLTRRAAEDLADRLLAACAVGYEHGGP